MLEITKISMLENDGERTLSISYIEDGNLNYQLLKEDAFTKSIFDAIDDTRAMTPHILSMIEEAIVTPSTEATAKKIADSLRDKLAQYAPNLICDGYHLYHMCDATSEKEQLDSVLEDHVLTILGKDLTVSNTDDIVALGNFIDKLYKNVDCDIRGQLVSWLNAQKWLTFTKDGRLIGYRGCQLSDDGVAESQNTGVAYVDGKRVNGHIPNADGTVVTMHREDVTHDPSIGCSAGLHVGTYNYAKEWGHDVILKVAVDPADVVSVPFECSAQKIRVCKFTVLEHTDIHSCAWNKMPITVY